MTRDEAYALLTKYLQNKNLIKHSLAAEAGMKAIYRRLTPEDKRNTQEEEQWGVAGLLHDIDYEIAQKESKLDRHGILFFEDPKYADDSEKIPENIAHAIKAHNMEATGVMAESPMDWAIADLDALTGLIVACALIHPDKKLASIDTDFVLKRFGEKAFAKGARRESISRCEETLNIPLRDFIEITLKAMQVIHEEIGL
ncbi:MAG: phosphohydrolase [Candidatus Levybacteria bacterium]|nr:phosphohydrolase [Candidatus Levybacteria bacterium]